jgi:hypothetical protein
MPRIDFAQSAAEVLHPMKRAFSLLAVTLFLAACGSSGTTGSSDSPPVEVRLAQTGSTDNVFYVRGPIALQYVLEVTNPTNDAYTLSRLELQSIGEGAYYLRTGSVPMNERIAANGTTAIKVAAWGTSRGGRLTASEPVTMRITAQFDDGRGHRFQRITTENLSQFGG